MSRLVIDVTGEQHQQIKALAALQGKTIKNFILEKLFVDDVDDEQAAWDELENLLAARIEAAENGNISTKTFEQITEEVIQARKNQQCGNVSEC